MSIPLPHIEKFVPGWVCFGLTGLVVAAFLALLIVLATSRRPDDHAMRNLGE
jgi:hypothetical protein